MAKEETMEAAAQEGTAVSEKMQEELTADELVEREQKELEGQELPEQEAPAGGSSQAEIQMMMDQLRKMNETLNRIVSDPDSFARKRSEVMTARERRAAMNREAREQNIKVSEGTDYVSEAQKEAEEANLLNQATRSRNTVLYGTVIEIREVDGIISAFVEEEHDETHAFPVMIPAREFFPFNPADYEGERKKHLNDEMVKRIGARVPFVLFQFVEKDRVAAGSRLAAMEYLCIQNFKKKKKDNVPEYVEGMKTEARVVSVRRDRIRLDVHGAEATVRGKDLGYKDYNRVEENYAVGDMVLVKIMNVEEYEYESYNRKYTLFDVEVSIKEAEEDPRVKYYNTFHVGSYVKGRVIDASTENGVFVDTGRMDILCKFPKVNGNKPLFPGREVTVYIQNMDDATHRIYGLIIR